jgi:hypothetical protein
LIELLFLLGFVVHTRGLYFRKKERKKEKMEEEERKEAFYNYYGHFTMLLYY